MLVQKKTLTFNKENNLWYVDCKEWEEKQTQLFRETHIHSIGNGNYANYKKELDLSDPLDNHTKHPKWRDPRQDLIMDESFGKLIEQKAHGKKTIAIEIVSYGWVSETFTHYECKTIKEDGALYDIRSDSNLQSQILLTPIFQYLFDGFYPKYIHLK